MAFHTQRFGCDSGPKAMVTGWLAGTRVREESESESGGRWLASWLKEDQATLHLLCSSRDESDRGRMELCVRVEVGDEREWARDRSVEDQATCPLCAGVGSEDEVEAARDDEYCIISDAGGPDS